MLAASKTFDFTDLNKPIYTAVPQKSPKAEQKPIVFQSRKKVLVV
jgi:hypothetical protein